MVDDFSSDNLKDEDGAYESTFEDILIRKFIRGIFSEHIIELAQEVIIKKKHNNVSIAFVMWVKRDHKQKANFLIGFTEELLSCYLKKNIKLIVQCNERRFRDPRLSFKTI